MKIWFKSRVSRLASKMKTCESYPLSFWDCRAEFCLQTCRDGPEPLRKWRQNLWGQGVHKAHLHQQSGLASWLYWAHQEYKGLLSQHSLYFFVHLADMTWLSQKWLCNILLCHDSLGTRLCFLPACESAFGCGACNTAGRSTLRCCSLGFWLGRPGNRGRFAQPLDLVGRNATAQTLRHFTDKLNPAIHFMFLTY